MLVRKTFNVHTVHSVDKNNLHIMEDEITFTQIAHAFICNKFTSPC